LFTAQHLRYGGVRRAIVLTCICDAKATALVGLFQKYFHNTDFSVMKVLLCSLVSVHSTTAANEKRHPSAKQSIARRWLR